MKYLLIGLILLSCNSRRSKTRIPVSTQPLDTIHARPRTVAALPLIFENAFVTGTRERVNKSDISFYAINIGKIRLTSGRVIACYPLHVEEYGKPYTQQFPIGEFPVQLSILQLGDQEAVAFSRIYFSDSAVARWQLALLQGQSPLPVGDDDIHGFGVDFGMAIYVDSAAVKDLDVDGLTNTDHALYKETDKNLHYDWRYAMYNFGSHNLAAFSTGPGDGYYASYIGFDAAGRPCRLLTDYGFVKLKGDN